MNINVEKQQSICLQLVNKIKHDIKYINDINNNKSGSDGGVGNQLDSSKILESMLQLRNQYETFTNLIEDEYHKPIESMSDKVDQLDIKLQSYRYEKKMLESEINQLKKHSFNIDDPSLGISTQSNFLSCQSQDYINIYNSKPKEKQAIERLEWEIYQRKLKMVELDNLHRLKTKTQQDDAKANNEFKQFQDKLKSTLNVTKSIEPFQKFIGSLPTSTTTKSNLNVQNNPLLLESSQPIYILYNELLYFKEFFANEYLQVDLLKMDSSNNDNGSDSMNIDNSTCDNASNIYISLKVTKNEQLLSIDFYYYPNLKFVTALPNLNNSLEMGLALLCNLDNLDNGTVTPNLSNHFLFERISGNGSGVEILKLDDLNLLGRPYKWVQFISGLFYLPEITSENMKIKTFQLHDFKPKTSHQILNEIINSL